MPPYLRDTRSRSRSDGRSMRTVRRRLEALEDGMVAIETKVREIPELRAMAAKAAENIAYLMKQYTYWVHTWWSAWRASRSEPDRSWAEGGEPMDPMV